MFPSFRPKIMLPILWACNKIFRKNYFRRLFFKIKGRWLQIFIKKMLIFKGPFDFSKKVLFWGAELLKIYLNDSKCEHFRKSQKCTKSLYLTEKVVLVAHDFSRPFVITDRPIFRIWTISTGRRLVYVHLCSPCAQLTLAVSLYNRNSLNGLHLCFSGKKN